MALRGEKQVPAKVGMTTEWEAQASRPVPPVLPLLKLFLAPRAGSTTVGRIAARCVCRLYRSCKTERNHCYQHNCSKGLHRFSPIKERVFVSRWRCHQREDGARLLIVIFRCEGRGIRGEYLGCYARSIEQILKGQKSGGPRNDNRRTEQTLAYGRF